MNSLEQHSLPGSAILELDLFLIGALLVTGSTRDWDWLCDPDTSPSGSGSAGKPPDLLFRTGGYPDLHLRVAVEPGAGAITCAALLSTPRPVSFPRRTHAPKASIAEIRIRSDLHVLSALVHPDANHRHLFHQRHPLRRPDPAALSGGGAGYCSS